MITAPRGNASIEPYKATGKTVWRSSTVNTLEAAWALTWVKGGGGTKRGMGGGTKRGMGVSLNSLASGFNTDVVLCALGCFFPLAGWEGKLFGFTGKTGAGVDKGDSEESDFSFFLGGYLAAETNTPVMETTARQGRRFILGNSRGAVNGKIVLYNAWESINKKLK